MIISPLGVFFVLYKTIDANTDKITSFVFIVKNSRGAEKEKNRKRTHFSSDS